MSFPPNELPPGHIMAFSAFAVRFWLMDAGLLAEIFFRASQKEGVSSNDSMPTMARLGEHQCIGNGFMRPARENAMMLEAAVQNSALSRALRPSRSQLSSVKTRLASAWSSLFSSAWTRKHPTRLSYVMHAHVKCLVAPRICCKPTQPPDFAIWGQRQNTASAVP